MLNASWSLVFVFVRVGRFVFVLSGHPSIFQQPLVPGDSLFGKWDNKSSLGKGLKVSIHPEAYFFSAQQHDSDHN